MKFRVVKIRFVEVLATRTLMLQVITPPPPLLATIFRVKSNRVEGMHVYLNISLYIFKYVRNFYSVSFYSKDSG